MGNAEKTLKMKEIEQVYPKTAEEKANMKKPYINQPVPDIMQLEIGKEYLYCACGLSKKQPWCDGSHVGTKFEPIKFVPKNKTNVMCLCKRSKVEPLCDNAHKRYMNITF